MVDPDIASQRSSFKLNSLRSRQSTLHRDAVPTLRRNPLQRLIYVAPQLAEMAVIAKEVLRSRRSNHCDYLHSAHPRAPYSSFPRLSHIVSDDLEILRTHVRCLIILYKQPDRVIFWQVFECSAHGKSAARAERFWLAQNVISTGIGNCDLFTKPTSIGAHDDYQNGPTNDTDNDFLRCRKHARIGYCPSGSVAHSFVAKPLIPSRSPSHKSASTFHPSFASLQQGPLRRNLLVRLFLLRGGVNNLEGAS